LHGAGNPAITGVNAVFPTVGKLRFEYRLMI
jgi:hypothetical protein